MPKMRCPVTRGDYKFNFTINLKEIVGFAATDVKYHAKVLISEVTKKRAAACVELVSWVKV